MRLDRPLGFVPLQDLSNAATVNSYARDFHQYMYSVTQRTLSVRPKRRGKGR